MKIAYEKMFTVIEILPDRITSLVVENPQILFGFLVDLKQAIEGYDTGIIISKNDIPVQISKKVNLVTDFVDFTLNQKSLLAKINNELEIIAKSEHFYQKSEELLAYVEKYILDLTLDLPCEMSCAKLSIQNLIKGAGITLIDEYDSLEERVLAYMDLSREFEGKELFVFVNLRSLLPTDKLQLLADTALNREHRVLLIDNMEYPKLEKEERHIIDNDLCEI